MFLRTLHYYRVKIESKSLMKSLSPIIRLLLLLLVFSNSLQNGAKYLNETGRTYLYLNGAGAYATTPARNFREGSFTIACWVKLLNPVTSESAIYSIWPKNEWQFLFQASMYGKVGFAAFNSDSGFGPVFSAG